ncbi:MAG: LacI family transcriptional regulator [Rhodobacterales bacterium]|nr:LacI family transcriptional regulator [Rhodobacterales bacterium]NCT13178.1 LacI family transcriptional regulator [Rhodobacterales bacterium]
MATLKDIGTELGLSVATVSRALNGFPEVNARTRDRVQQAAERMGYRPNRIAQRLVTGRSGMVGMIVKIRPDMSSEMTFFEILTGLTAALAARDTDLVLAVDQADDPVVPYQRMLERGILDGFILNAPVPDDPRVAWLQARGIPFVMHGQSDAQVDYPFYGIDNRAVMADSVGLLAALGHRRIAFLNGEVRLAFAADRRAGFRAAMAAEGLAVPEAFIASDQPGESYGYARALAMLSGRLGPRPTAVICASTVIAAGVMQAARDLALAVPRDLSVMAHDDALPQLRAINFSPTLTVTRAPMREACVPLANHLIDHIDGVAAARLQTLIRAEVIVRNSTGPVPEGGHDPWH